MNSMSKYFGDAAHLVTNGIDAITGNSIGVARHAAAFAHFAAVATPVLLSIFNMPATAAVREDAKVSGAVLGATSQPPSVGQYVPDPTREKVKFTVVKAAPSESRPS